MERKKYAVLDHPIIGYFLLAIFGYIMSSIGTIGDTIIGFLIPGYLTYTEVNGRQIPSGAGVCVAVVTVGAVIIFYVWFKPYFKGMLKKKALLTGLLMLLPFLLFHYAGSVVSWFEWGTTTAWGVVIAFLRAFAPGFGEEITYRGLGVANYMRTIKDEKGIYVIFFLSSAVFGAVHLANSFSGAPLGVSVIQAVYAMGVGMALCAVYLRTGNLLPTIIGHLTVDFMEFIRNDLSASGGVMQGMGIGDWITIAAGAFAAGWGIFLIRKKYHSDIMALWAEKWSQ
ncbi:MAG: CPBP family intramembrane metalloprotease [Saccharofermentans sp.]|nr:CPBP family intramembrane metalloprotease [Saccharofermentans sp.]